jgi:hypothetical protein
VCAVVSSKCLCCGERLNGLSLAELAVLFNFDFT